MSRKDNANGGNNLEIKDIMNRQSDIVNPIALYEEL